MDRFTLWATATLAILFPVVAEAVIASPGDTDETGIVTLCADDLDNAVLLLEDWLYQSGDDPSWSRPELDDTSWERLSTAWLEEPPASGWTGIG